MTEDQLVTMATGCINKYGRLKKGVDVGWEIIQLCGAFGAMCLLGKELDYPKRKLKEIIKTFPDILLDLADGIAINLELYPLVCCKIEKEKNLDIILQELIQYSFISEFLATRDDIEDYVVLCKIRQALDVLLQPYARDIMNSYLVSQMLYPWALLTSRLPKYPIDGYWLGFNFWLPAVCN